MNSIKELVQHLDIEFSQLEDIEFLETIDDIHALQKSLNDINSNLIEEVTKDLGWEGTAQIENEELLKEVLSGCDSVTFAAALRELPFKLEIKALMSEQNLPMHYYGELEFEGETYYADPYGIFYRVDEVQRSEEKGTPKTLDFDNDECPAVRYFRDAEASLLDEMPGEDCGEQVEYAEVYYAQLITKWAGAINESKAQNSTSTMAV